ncbi:hypothetical protein [Halogranum gelatinilyticum]|uniref:hypothetical protein n=1 Tax=Halogranum gelatinilyticum TaxID=660521 RepID=UPI001FCE1616|nr:hypothetical protein [Halogranum gelatinilyticum]
MRVFSLSTQEVIAATVLLAAIGTVGSLVATAFVWAVASGVGSVLWRAMPQHIPAEGIVPVTGFGGTIEYLLEERTLVVLVGLFLHVGVPLVAL